MNTMTVNNILQDDKLINLIKSNFNESDLQLFELNYKIYTTCKNNLNDFIIDLDEVWKWIGYNKKSDAKKVLINIKTLFENKDYKILLRRSPQQKSSIDNRGGYNREQILLTINCFKKFCLKASTEQSEKIYDYYIKMEDIITIYIENKHNEIIKDNKTFLELKDKETNQLLQLKDIEIEANNKILELKNQQIENNRMQLEESLTRLHLKNLEIESFKNRKYEEIEKNKNVYIFSCDKPNIYKIGKSKDVELRRKQLQTANVDKIIIHHTRPTSDDYILELVVHSILDQYRCKSNGEHFTGNLDYLKMVIDMSQVFFYTLKSTYEYISKDEFLLKINENILNQSTIEPYELSIDTILESNNKLKKLNKKNIIIPITETIITNNLDSSPQIPEPFNVDNDSSVQNPVIVSNNHNPSIISNNLNTAIVSNNQYPSILSTDINIKNYSLLNYGSKNSYRTIRTCQLCNTVLKSSDSDLYKHQLTNKCSKLRNAIVIR